MPRRNATSRNERLVTLAQERFNHDLLSGERQLLMGYVQHQTAFEGASQDKGIAVRGMFVRWLLTDPEAASLLVDSHVVVLGSAITGDLNLSGIRSTLDLTFTGCTFEGNIELIGAEIPAFSIMQATGAKSHPVRVNALDGTELRTGSILLADCEFSGPVDFTSSIIRGSFGCLHCRFRGSNTSLSLNVADVKEVHLRNSCRLDGALDLGGLHCERDVDLTGVAGVAAVSLRDAEIGGDVDLSWDGRAKPTIQTADFAGMQTGGGLLLGGRSFAGKGVVVQLDGARIASHLSLVDVYCPGEVSGVDIEIGGNLLCDGDPRRQSFGALDFSGAHIKGGVGLSGVNFTGSCQNASGKGISLELATATMDNALLQGITSTGSIDLSGIQVARSVFLADVASVSADLTLISATIGGDLEWKGDKNQFHGAIDLSRIVVRGSLSCGPLSISSDHAALHLDSASIGGDCSLGTIDCCGPLSMDSIKIGGNFFCFDISLTGHQGYITANLAQIGNSSYFSGKRFQLNGPFFLAGSQIAGFLTFSQMSLNSPLAVIKLTNASVKKIAFSPDFSTFSNVNLEGVRIDGNLNCSDAEFKGDGVCVLMDGAVVTGGVSFKRATVAGTVHLNLASIGMDLDCSGADFQSAMTCLNAERSTIHGSLMCVSFPTNTFRCNGTLDLTETHIYGDLDCPGPGSIAVLNCTDTQIDGKLIWGFRSTTTSRLILNGAKVGTLQDAHFTWPHPGNLQIEGFQYRNLILVDHLGHEHSATAANRLPWLRLQSQEDQLKEQPWNQLAAVLESQGAPQDGRVVLYNYSVLQDHHEHPISWAAHQGYDWIAENPLHVIAPITCMWVLGFFVFRRARLMSCMVPVEKDAFGVFASTGQAPEHYREFHPGWYATETVLPAVQIGQTKQWHPGRLQRRTIPRASVLSHLRRWLVLRLRRSGKLSSKVARSLLVVSQRKWRKRPWRRLRILNYSTLSLFQWLLVVCGWILALVLVAAITERFRTH